MLYGVIQILQSLFPTLYKICYGNPIHYFIHSIIQLLPYLQGLTGIAAFTDVRIAKDPADYTVGMILRLTEGSLAPVACLEDGADICER